jgi:hypothetical protein
MKKLFLIVILLPLFGLGQPDLSIKKSDFKPLAGEWKGSLTYLDYGSGKPYSMAATITIPKINTRTNMLILKIEYPGEPKANGNDTLEISNDRSKLDDAKIISRKKKTDGDLEIITEMDGVDGNDNRKAVLRHIYSIGKKRFSVRKEVRFDGEESFILRNEFKMIR